MFLKDFLNNIAQSKTVAGVELFIKQDGSILYNVVVLEKSKKNIKVQFSQSAISGLENLRNVIPVKTPVAIVVNGKGLIHKKVILKENDNDDSLIQKVLPNANAIDFYYQKLKTSDNSNIISIARKSALDEIIADFEKSGLDVISCSVGPFLIKNIIPLIKQNSDYFELMVPGFKLLVNNGEIENFSMTTGETESAQINLAGESIANNLIQSFSAAFQYFLDESLQVSTNIPNLSIANEENKQKRLFQKAGWGILIFLLSIVMVNLFVFNHYWSKKQKLQTQSQASEGALIVYEKLMKDYSEKKNFLEQTGLLHSSMTSYYADQIASIVPESIQLTQMNVFPMIKKQEMDSVSSFAQQSISVSGQCSKSVELNEWINSLKKIDFTSDVLLVNYNQDKGENKGEFTLEIKIK